MRRELLLGCGAKRDKLIAPPDHKEWEGLVTLDVEARHDPDVVWDLNQTPWPFEDDSADEIHAYEVLEHLGQQGDAKAFFAHFWEMWRILKPGGLVIATVPSWKSMWAFGDPGHRRVINGGSLIFLNQEEYHNQVGVTAMCDYRNTWRGDFVKVSEKELEHQYCFVLEAVKPARLERRTLL